MCPLIEIDEIQSIKKVKAEKIIIKFLSFLENLRKSDQAVQNQAKLTEILKNIMNFL